MDVVQARLEDRIRTPVLPERDEQLADAEKVRIGGVVQLVVRVKEATKPRQGRNPATGEEITISAKPASVALKARPLAKAKAALPSVQKARKRLAA